MRFFFFCENTDLTNVCMYQKCICFNIFVFHKAQTGALVKPFKTENFNVMFLNTADSVLIRYNFLKISLEIDGTIL